MAKFYSPSRKGFFDDAIHGAQTIDAVDEEVLTRALLKAGKSEKKREALLADPPTKLIPNPASQIPEDAIELSDGDYDELIAELSHGKLPAVVDGKVVALEPTLSIEEQLATIRAKRDRALARTDWTQMPDALAAAKRQLWADHRQALRDLPAAVEKALKAGRKPPEFPQAPNA